MAIITKLTKDAKLKLGIKKGVNGSFVSRGRVVSREELLRERHPAYNYIF